MKGYRSYSNKIEITAEIFKKFIEQNFWHGIHAAKNRERCNKLRSEINLLWKDFYSYIVFNFFTLEKGVTFVEIHFQNIFERCVIAVNYLFSNPMLKIHTQSLFPINARLSKKLPGKISKNFGPVKISLFLKKQDKGVGSPWIPTEFKDKKVPSLLRNVYLYRMNFTDSNRESDSTSWKTDQSKHKKSPGR